MSTRYISFISGIVIASLTWTFSLYLYSRLSQNTNTVNPTMIVLENSKLGKELEFYHNIYTNKDLRLHNNLIIHHTKENAIHKNTYNLKGNNFKNNDKMLQQLRSISVKSAVTLEQGIFKIY